MEASGKSVSAAAGFSTLARGVADPKRSIRLSLNTSEKNKRGTELIGHLTEAYEAMEKRKGFSGKTTEGRIYSCRLKKNGLEICRLTQPDYPSGLLRGSKPPTKEQREYFDYFLKHASILAFLVSGDLLQNYIRLGGKNAEEMTEMEHLSFLEINREMSHIKTLLLRADEVNPHVPLLFYITKSDLMANPQNIPLVLERLLRNWNLVDEKRKILGCSSILGRHVVMNKEDSSGYVIKAGFAPEDFEIPLLLAAARRLSVLGKRQEKKELKALDESIMSLTIDREKARSERNL